MPAPALHTWHLIVLVLVLAGAVLAADKSAPLPTTQRVGLVYGEIYLDHKTTVSHPEQPARLTSILDRLRETKLLDQLVIIAPRDAEMQWLRNIHSQQYIEHVRQACEENQRLLDSGDTPISASSYKSAIAAAGGVMAAIDEVAAGRVSSAFCAIRPPGHHALKDRAMGFCIFNNIAIAARYAQQKHKLAKVLIVDWDVHHGNGTQAAFDDDPSVFYFSVHRSPFYPRTGAAEDVGVGQGRGTKLNVPMHAGATDAEYIEAFKEKLVPAARTFRPDIVMISAGFDAHADDPLGGMKLTADGYAQLTRIVKGIAIEHCGGRLVSVLEGGYNLTALAASVEAHIRALME